MTTLFISDLHLDAGRPAAIERFCSFAATRAVNAQDLYILGDLFEAWIGDDDADELYVPVLDALLTLVGRGVRCHFMHGNRDFLIGERFAEMTGCKLLGEYETIRAGDSEVLLTHGDLLCTDDEPYMALRAQLHDPAWQRAFLAKPLQERRAIAAQLRDHSRTATALKPQDIMDVNQGTVETVMRSHGVRFLLHGHTHRPGVHRFELDGAQATRIVLGAWYEQGSVVIWDDDGFRLETVDV